MRLRAAALLALSFAVIGCGCGGSSSSTATTTQAQAPNRGPKPPKGASPALRGIYRNFPPPKADPEVPASAKAIKAGEAACKGKTPTQVKERYLPVAIRREAIDPQSPQGKMIAGLTRYEKSPDAAYTAGQLAGDAYEASLGQGSLGEYGYRGCAYALARGVEGRLGD